MSSSDDVTDGGDDVTTSCEQWLRVARQSEGVVKTVIWRLVNDCYRLHRHDYCDCSQSHNNTVLSASRSKLIVTRCVKITNVLFRAGSASLSFLSCLKFWWPFYTNRTNCHPLLPPKFIRPSVSYGSENPDLLMISGRKFSHNHACIVLVMWHAGMVTEVSVWFGAEPGCAGMPYGPTCSPECPLFLDICSRILIVTNAAGRKLMPSRKNSIGFSAGVLAHFSALGIIVYSILSV